jgi:L-alanine-DL-glutamate epimerase-like enolase superfamily enzyme
MISPIASVDAVVLRAPSDPLDLDGSSETILVRIRDAEGREGIGEADAPATVVRELIEMSDVHSWSRGLRSILLGRDPFRLGAAYRAMYEGTIYHGRRGLGLHAISAADMALHDLAARQLGRPVYDLLGGPVRDSIVPYATVYPGAPRGRTVAQIMQQMTAMLERALQLGFRAVKMELPFGDVHGREIAAAILEARQVIGPDVMLCLDCLYQWHDWREARWVLDRAEDADVYFAEAALQHDDLRGHARLARAVRTRVAGAEFAAGIHECRQWIAEAEVDVLQPDVSRSGGLWELRRIAEMAELEGVLVIPHGWKTGITAAAQRHFMAATPNTPYVEMLHPELFDSRLRAELTHPEPKIVDGRIELPTEPGLGVELSAEALERYTVA